MYNWKPNIAKSVLSCYTSYLRKIFKLLLGGCGVLPEANKHSGERPSWGDHTDSKKVWSQRKTLKRTEQFRFEWQTLETDYKHVGRCSGSLKEIMHHGWKSSLQLHLKWVKFKNNKTTIIIFWIETSIIFIPVVITHYWGVGQFALVV